MTSEKLLSLKNKTIHIGGGNIGVFSQLSGSEPPFEPKVWNGKKDIKKTHNCYAYAFNIVDPDFSAKPQPGYASGFSSMTDDEIRNCDVLMERMMKDNPSIMKIGFSDKCPEGYRKAYLAVDDSDDPDYHFYRLDKNGYWSHKPGATNATNTDGSNQKIIDPAKANRKGSAHNYRKSCSYFCYDPSQSKISNKYGGSYIIKIKKPKKTKKIKKYNR